MTRAALPARSGMAAAGFLLAALLVLVAGCGSNGPPRGTATYGDPGTASPPAGSVVWQVSGSAGLQPAYLTLAARPSVTIYADGRAVLATTPWPSTGRPPLRGGSVPTAALSAFLDGVESSGLFDGPAPDFGTPRVSDAGSTTVTARDASGRVTSRAVYALGLSGIDDGLTRQQAQHRRRLESLVRRSLALVHAGGRYLADEVEVLAVGGNGAVAHPLRWPTGSISRALSGALRFGNSARLPCGLLTGEPAHRLQELAAGRVQAWWTDGSHRRLLVLVPLLPGERPRCLARR